MRNALLILSLFFFAAAATLLATGQLRHTSPETLAVDAREYHFGVMRPVVARHNYILTNNFPYQIQMLSVTRTCGCTQALLNKVILRPHESAILSCMFNLAGKAGDFATSLTVLYRRVGGRETETRGVVCAAYATVDPIVRLSAAELRFDPDRASAKTISLNITDGHSRVTAISVEHKAFRAELAPDRVHITVAFDPTRWAPASGVPRLIINTDCVNETNIRVPLVVQRATSGKPVSGFQ